MRIVLTPQARADYVEAVDWYAHQAPGLEKRIRAAFRTVRLRMMENPDQFPQATVATRRVNRPLAVEPPSTLMHMPIRAPVLSAMSSLVCC